MKASIIEKIKKNRPAEIPLPSIPSFENSGEKLESFIASVTSIAAKVIIPTADQDLKTVIDIAHPSVKRVVNMTSKAAIKGLNLTEIDTPKDLHPLDLAIIEGSFGVIENGAIWIVNDSLKMRAVPFLAEHLVVVLSREEIVYNMHEAYQRLEEDTADYGVFIAGPSKTADIEQCLVIGAQGPKSLLVILI